MRQSPFGHSVPSLEHPCVGKLWKYHLENWTLEVFLDTRGVQSRVYHDLNFLSLQNQLAKLYHPTDVEHIFWKIVDSSSPLYPIPQPHTVRVWQRNSSPETLGLPRVSIQLADALSSRFSSASPESRHAALGLLGLVGHSSFQEYCKERGEL